MTATQAPPAGDAPLPKPPWIRIRLRSQPDPQMEETRALMRRKRLVTVCEEAACPNLGECWSQAHATVMILGEICTRACAFCNVKTGMPDAIDPDEPRHVAEAVGELGLRHVVITSVDRDDLEDGGSGQFVRVIEELRRSSPTTTVEILTPDFRRKSGAVEAVTAARPDVYNHNLETVPRLYRGIRPGASYTGSLALLARVKELDPTIFTKSGIMLGLGESRKEVLAVMDDMRAHDIDFITIGQYLRPTPRHASVARYWTPEEFEEFGAVAEEKGFTMVSSSPLTRSSYHADADFQQLRERREAELRTRGA